MGNTRIGTMLSELAFTNYPIILKNLGFDFLIIDAEHGAFDYSEMARIITISKLVGIDSVVRLSDNLRKDITKYMDMGASGLILPMTNTKEDIEQVVKYAKYSPEGLRGISTTRIHTMYNPVNLEEYMEKANCQTRVYAQLETVAGVENSYEILQTDNVCGGFVGPNDLACDLKRNKNYGKTVLDCISIVSQNARMLDKEWGIITTDMELISFSKEHGTNNISYGSELNMILKSAKNAIQTLKP